MAVTSFDNLINVLTSSKAVFWQENESLPEIEIQRLWQIEWNYITSQVDGISERHGSIIPSKRSTPGTLSGNGHPPSKHQKLSPLSHPLERQTSAPAGTSMSRTYTQSSTSRPISITNRRMSGTVAPTRQQASQLRRGNTETIRSFQNPVIHTITQPRLQPLYPVNEVQDFSPADYLSQSPYASVTLCPILERGELQTQDFSYLSTSSRSDFTWPISYSSSLPTSDTDSAIASTATSSVMSRKAEIPRTTYQQPQRRTTFCQLCDNHPQGFHGEHELSRHIERHHRTHRKVWICKDNPLTDGRRPVVPLSNCKACRNSKTYGANYNAAAHLRRAHFFPCKNKRGGRGKVSEGRGGMGGGEEPSMDELKNWMYEKIEINVAGNVLQSTSPELSQINTDIFTGFNQFDNAVSYNYLTLSIPQQSANSYDWNTTQFGVGESCQFINSAGSVIESAKPLSRMKSDGLERRRYKLAGPQPVDAVTVPSEILRAEEERVLKELLLGKECSVCGEPITDSRAVYGALTPSCTHKWSVVICRGDLQTYLATRMAPEDGRVSSSIPCWAPNCNATLRHHDIQQHANIQDFEAYDDALLRQAIHAGESFAECSTNGCRGGGWVDSTSNITYFVCGLCYRITCIEHNGPYETHAGKPCPATAGRRAQTERERERREKEDRASEQLLKKTARLGPCGHWVSKIDGCDHITCKLCSWEFCYLCGANYVDIRRQGNSAHKPSCAHYREFPHIRH